MDFAPGGSKDAIQKYNRIQALRARPLPQRIRLRQVIRNGLPLVLAGAFLILLMQQLEGLDLSAVMASARQVSALQWGLALFFTALSFLAVGRYDVLVHRMLKTDVQPERALKAGITAIAISQTTGFGLFTGTLSRWRMLPEISLYQAGRMTAIVAVTFLSGWLVTVALVLLISGAPDSTALANLPAFTDWLIPLGLVTALLSVLFSLLQPRRLPLPAFPSLKTLFSVVALTALDTFTACGALWVLLPDAANPGLQMLIPVFLLAFGLGLICGSPAGVGPFEVAIFALLPLAPQAELLAGILAWRLVYYLIPALLGVTALAFGQKNLPVSPHQPRPTVLTDHPPSPLLQARAPFAEAGLAWQEQLKTSTSVGASVSWLTGDTGQALVALRAPLDAPSETAALQILIRTAQTRGKLPCLYKCPARLATVARRKGWKILRIAEEAWIIPANWTLNTPARRGLRRKIRKVEKSDTEISYAPWLTAEDQARMTEISANWAGANRGERGFSMGRYCPQYLTRQKVFVARRNGRIIAFVSFHQNPKEWALDLMRQGENTPDGTMQGLITAALDMARAQGIPRLSLAAMPVPAYPCLISRAVYRKQEGLRRFKLGFAPQVSPLYIACPGWISLGVSAIDIARAICRPPALHETPANRTFARWFRAPLCRSERNSQSL